MNKKWTQCNRKLRYNITTEKLKYELQDIDRIPAESVQAGSDILRFDIHKIISCRILSSGIKLREVLWKSTKVLEEHVTSILKNKPSKNPA
jgi:hypothetical protein